MKKTGIIIAFVMLTAVLFTWIAMAAHHDQIDPVCGMTVTAEAPITAELDGSVSYFCSDHCKEAFTQNPAKYSGVHESTSGHGGCPGMKKSATVGESGTSAKSAGCGGCVMKSAGCGGSEKSSSSSGSNCGNTRIEQVNNFHSVMHPLHQAVQSGDYQTVRNSVGAVQESSKTLNRADLPDDICTKEYKSARKALQKSVKRLVKSCNKRSDERVLADFNTMHERYEALQTIVQ